MWGWIVDHAEGLATIGSGFVGAIGLLVAWFRYRHGELRRDDVHRWADEAIAALQAVRLITSGQRMRIGEDEQRERLTQLMFDTSILVERGRLFFRNARGSHGREKQGAYRGRRPEILDQIVVAHQIACAWPDADAAARAGMRLVAEDVLRRFVTLMQAEVGRVRTASAGTRRRGDGADLTWRIRDLDPDRLEDGA